VVDLYGYPRRELIGLAAGWALTAEERATAEAEWQSVLERGETYGEREIYAAGGKRMRVQYAIHATFVDSRWLALAVTISARATPDGNELIAGVPVEWSEGAEKHHLTRREREVVALVALGRSSREIAGQLIVSPDTVRTHVRNAMEKTETHTRAQLVATALAERLIDD
jgi:DNA-binding CsgD family transcriptional regulator